MPNAQLGARPAPATTTAFSPDAPTGLHKLEVGGGRDSVVFVSR